MNTISKINEWVSWLLWVMLLGSKDTSMKICWFQDDRVYVNRLYYTRLPHNETCVLGFSKIHTGSK